MDTIWNIVNKLDQLKIALDEHRLRLESTRKSQVPLISTEHGLCLVPESALFQILFELNPCWITLSTFEEGCILKANKKFFEFSGFREDEVIGKTSIQLGLWPCPKERQDAMRLIDKEKLVTAFPLRVRTKFGELRDMVGSACLVRTDNRQCLLTVAKEKSESIITTESQRERKATRRIGEQLKEIETAIHTLIDSSIEKESVRERITTILKKNIFPFIEDLKTMKLDQKAITYLTIIETNLSTLLSSFPCLEDHNTAGLTPTEIHVIELVRQGKTSKEIASLLNVSPSAISFHRNNIRKKLNLHNKTVSLSSYLQSR